MKAKEVLKRYEQGERDFRGVNLRGQNFKGKNLSGCDFSQCDLTGANFRDAILTGTKFTQAKADLRTWWKFFLLTMAVLLILLSTSSSASISSLIAPVFNNSLSESNIIAWITLISTVIYSLVNFRYGLNKGLQLIAITSVLATSITIIYRFFNPVSGINSLLLGAMIIILVPFSMAYGIFAASVIFTIIERLSLAIIFITIPIIIATFQITEVDSLIITSALFINLMSIYLGWRVTNNDPRDSWFFRIVINYIITGETNFEKADLTDADFTGAILKGTNFSKANLTRTCFKNAQKLNLAKVDDTLLSQPAVRDLLISGNGYKKDYFKADLRGANLEDANLQEANLRQADLSQATLKNANLSQANLTEVNAINTDFTGAYMTGACLESWNINSSTILDHVDCQYIYLLEQTNQHGSRDRRPYDPDKVFQLGEFEKLYQKIQHTSQLLLRNGFNKDGFSLPFAKIMEENSEITYISHAVEKTENNDLLVTLEIPGNMSREKIEQEFLHSYELALQSIEEKYKARIEAIEEKYKAQLESYQAQLESKTNIIESQRRQITNLDYMINNLSESIKTNLNSESQIN